MQAQDSHAPENTFRWKVRDDCPSAVEILGLDARVDSKAQKELIVPDEIDGKQVVAIGGSAFKGCSSLTSIDLPVGLTTIGENAFFGIPDDCVFRAPAESYAYRWAIENGYDVEIRRRDS